MEAEKPLSRSMLRRQREKEMRCRSILDAAESLFALRGYQQTSMEQIADLAELSVGTVYFYFKKKEEILITLMADIAFALRQLLGEAVRRSDGSIQGLRNAGEAFFSQFCSRHPEKIAIFFRESVGQSLEVERLRKQLLMQITSDIQDFLTHMQATGHFAYADDRLFPELMAVCIVGIYERVACHYLLWKDDGAKADMAKLAEGAVAFTLGGVRSLIVAGGS